MTLKLPEPIVAYFTADKGDRHAVAECFTSNAVVIDEGRTYQGRAAIEQWKADASAQYQYTVEPLAGDEMDGKFVVASKVTGTFPGSPVVRRYFFGLDGESIASLEVIS